MANIPTDLRYARTHEWTRVEDGIATVGISDHAQQELTELVFVELPAVGRQVQAGEACSVVESVKTASDIYAPLSGEITGINQAVADDPSLVNSDPYGRGWFFKIRLASPAEADQLLSSADYGNLTGAA